MTGSRCFRPKPQGDAISGATDDRLNTVRLKFAIDNILNKATRLVAFQYLTNFSF